MPARDAMPARCASLAMAAAAASLSLLQPAYGQAGIEEIPEELRIIQDFPGPADDLGEVGQVPEQEEEDPALTDERGLGLDEDRDSLFDDDRSTLLDMRDPSRSQRLLSGDLDPGIDRDFRTTVEERLDPGSPAMGRRVTGARDRIGAGAGGTAGAGTGGTGGGSLF